jgi:hypothetical protein
MATYYVRPDGSNTNAGTGPGAGQAWATVAFALGAASGTNPGLVGGDTVYIAPGTYRNTVTIGYTTPTSMITVQGDPSCSQFSGLTAGPVRITNAPVGDTAPTRGQFFTGTTDYLTLRNIQFDGLSAYSTGLVTLTGGNITVDKCVFQTYTDTNNGFGLWIIIGAGKNNITVSNSIFWTHSTSITINLNNQSSSNYATNTNISNCYVRAGITWTNTTAGQFSGLTIRDCTITSTVFNGNNNAGTGNSILNCIIDGGGGRAITQWNTGSLTATNCTYIGSIASSNVTFVNSNTNMQLFDLGQSRLWGIGQVETFSPQQGSVMLNAGTTGGTASDLMGVTWLTPSTPTLGTLERSSTSTVGSYLPTERNASAITIAPASTSQSIELYLGATGLTASTSGLSARYNRTRTASVSIPLVARVIDGTAPTGGWIAGGFAEVDSVNMPGVYRLDLPNDALAAGADDVTVVVRGASGTNGAVMTIKLSSGGLTGAQTASAVWGASVAGYVAETDFGGVVNATRNVVGGIETNVQDIPQTVWDEPKANHTIPNTFGDYLDTKVSTGADTSRIQLRQGPFLIKQNATEGLITEVNQFLSTVPNMEIVLIDSSGGAVSVAGSTLVLRVRNQAGTAVVNNVTPTVAYADGGVIRWTPNLSWNALSVTTPGTYRIIVERTMGTTTTTFGPFLVQLSSG